MENESKSSSILPLSVLILAFGLGGVYLYDQPYSSVRPSDVSRPVVARGATETIDARLWEDPFEAIARSGAASPCTGWSYAAYNGETAGGGNTTTGEHGFVAYQATASRQLIQLAYEVHSRSNLADRDPAVRDEEKRVVIMPVMVPGEPYFEQAETRRRLRYAVHSGLAASGFVPESSAHIGVVDVCWDFAGRLSTASGRAVPLPYEWLVIDPLQPPDARRPSAVLVLWLNESELGGNPWVRIDDLLGHLVGYRDPDADRSEPVARTDGPYSFRMIGPATSDVLGALLAHQPPPPGSLRPAARTGGAERTNATVPATGDEASDPEARRREKLEKRRSGDPTTNGEDPGSGAMNKTAGLDGEPRSITDQRHLDPDSSVERLLEVTWFYLDDPDQLFGSGLSYIDDLRSLLRPAVDQVLSLPDEAVNAAQAAPWSPASDRVLGSLARELSEAGAHVDDSDPYWYRTVPQIWLTMILEDPVTPQSEQPEPSYLGGDLCVRLTRNNKDQCPVEIDLANSLNPNSAPDHVPTLAERLYYEVRRYRIKLRSSYSLSEGLAHLASALRAEAMATERRELKEPATIEATIGEWIIRHQGELVGRLEPPRSILRELTLYNNRATAPASLLVGLGTGDPKPESWDLELRRGIVRAAYGNAKEGELDLDLGPHFVPVIHHDNELAPLLIDELHRRGVDVCSDGGADHVALIGEWDTLYGRALPLTLQAEVLRCREATVRRRREERLRVPNETQAIYSTTQDAILALLAGDVAPPARVAQFQYLRGLDGVSAALQTTVDGRANPAIGGGDATGVGGFSRLLPWSVNRLLERAQGNRQFDYMRRLADQLSDYGEELREKDGELRAIGVVGTDAYDKLLVLQALRTRFPRTLFFTTDLDARMFHPADRRWNRNMIIASSFDLRLDPVLQGNIPPFRDSYQTSTFLAVRGAMDAELLGRGATFRPSATAVANGLVRQAARTQRDLSSAGAGAARRASLTFPAEGLVQPLDGAGPRLFEVGRNGPYQLTVEAEGTTSEGQRLHPRRRWSRPRGTTVALVALVSTLGVCLLIPVVPNLRRFTVDRWAPDRTDEIFVVNLFTVLVLLTLAVFVWLIYEATGDAAGEPVELLEGISIWPTEAIRMITAVLSIFFIGLGYLKLRKNEKDLADRHGLRPGRRKTLDGCWTLWRQARRGQEGGRLRQWLRGFRTAEPRGFLTLLRHGLSWPRDERAGWWRARRDVSINVWRCALDGGGKETGGLGDLVDGEDTWDRYAYLGRLSHRLTRFLPVAGLYFLLGHALIQLFGQPHVPHRGEFSYVADRIILMSSVGLTILLTFFVVDATRLCERFIDALAERPTKWSDEVEQRMAKRRHVDPRDVGDVIDLELIGDRTEVVGNLILYPFVVLFLMIVSRASVFDNWDWPAGLLLILGLSSAYALMCAVVLRRAAERARRKTIEHLRTNLHQAIAEEKGPDGPRSAQIRLLIEEAQALRRGAFTHWTHHPVVKAVLLPFSGVGVLALIELLSVMGR